MKDVNEILNDIKTELGSFLNAAEYMLWINGLTPVSCTQSEIVVCAPSDNARNTLEANYVFKFLDAAKKAGYPLKNVHFITEKERKFFTDESSPNPEEVPMEAFVPKKPNPFISRYTFDHFVVGDSNRIAFEISQRVAENPGINEGLLTFNPLYIYGGVGLGKTHLLHSIGNYIYKNNPSLDVVYVSTETLTNEYFASLTRYSTDKDAYRTFREKYVNADVLMLDDVQYLQKRGGLQDVIFHIFNELYNKGKQIVLSSDRPPKDINDIEDRLASRFQGGFMADIYAPNIETRISIIMKKLESTGMTLDKDIIDFLAERINTNIRELEGALLKVIMFAQLNGRKPTIELAKEALKETENSDSSTVDSAKIIDAVSEYCRVPKSDIIGKKKTKEIAEARMIAIYLAYDILNIPLITIGQIFGGRDHTTIMYSRNKIASSLATNQKIAKAIRDIKDILNVGDK